MSAAVQLPSVTAAARDNPDGVAVLGPGGPLTYAELARAVAGAAQELRTTTIRPGEPVGLLARPTVASLVCLLALAERRVPMLLIHPRTPDADRERMLTRAGARVWFAPDSAKLTPITTERGGGSVLFDDVFAIAPTSGSTGLAKLVLLGRRAIGAAAAASVQHVQLRRADRWLLCLPLAHVGGLSIVTRSIVARSTMVLHDAGARGLLHDVRALASALHGHSVTLASFVPTVLDALVAHDAHWRPPETLRAVLVGGAAASEALLDRARQRGVYSLTTYGLTEACSQVTAMPLGSRVRVRDGIVSAGVPLPGVEVTLDRDERIRFRGANVCSGFVDSASPIDSDGWFLTEDRGRFDADGHLYVIGRVGERIITGGENVDPLRVEAALESIPGVVRACVFGLPDERFGELVACALVCSSHFDRNELEPAIRRLLARHEEPRKIALLRDLPQLPNGKIDRARTRELALVEFAGGVTPAT